MTDNLLGDRYEIGDRLGYGGMSEVFRGRDVRLGRDVAIKVLRADLARDPTFQTRFRREAQHAAALNHPAIVAVYDTGEMTRDGGSVPYIVMEYVDGETLRDVVKREGPMSAQRAMEITADVSAALDFSHRHGIIHRDMKPANVMLTRAGAVKVMDFGIARAATDGQATVTATAAVIGTAQYLSPEQARGEQVDARSDVYAAGCVLYELLTGNPPFVGDSPVAVAYQHVREEPKPPSAARPGIGHDVDAVVLKALNKNPMNRYQSAADMRADLIRALSGQSVLATPVMNESDRTEMLGAVPPPTASAAHAAPAAPVAPGVAGAAGASILEPQDGWDDDDRRPGRIWGFVGIGVVCALLLAGAVYLTFKITSTDSTVAKVQVPPVVNMSPDDGTATLADHHLRVGDIKHAPSSPEQQGLIIQQDPSDGQVVDRNTAVTLTVGDGIQQVTVPNVQGLKREAAKKDIKSHNLKYAEEKIYSSTPEGRVDHQDPERQTRVKPGTTVTVYLSKGTKMTTIPDKDALVGVPQDEATAVLDDANLTWVIQPVSSDKPKGEVVSIGGGLAPGDKVQVDTPVTLMVSKEDEMEMPSLDNKKPEDAVKALQADDVGWLGTSDYLTITKEANPNRALWGRITGQSPEAGEIVKKNAPIQVTVADRPSMPDLTGMTKDEVLKALHSKGWTGTVTVVTDIGETPPKGKGETVIADTQEPAVGEQIPDSDSVTVHIYPPEESPTTSTPPSSPPSSEPGHGGGGSGHGGGSGDG